MPNAEPLSSVSIHFSSRSVRTSACRLDRGYPTRSCSSDRVSRAGEAASASRMRTVRSADLTKEGSSTRRSFASACAGKRSPIVHPPDSLSKDLTFPVDRHYSDGLPSCYTASRLRDHIHICELEVPAVLNRRVTTACVTLLAVVMTSAGCGGDDATSAAGQNEKAELEIWTRRTPGSEQEKTTQRLAEAFTKKTGVPTMVVAIFEGFETKLQQRAQQKDLPDIVINDTAQLGTMHEQGLVREVNKDDIDGADDIADRAWDAAKAIDGKYYAVPTSAQSFALFVRKDWREKVGMEQPKSWDDLVTLGKAFTEKDPDGNGKKDTAGFIIPASTERGYASWYWST